jgi:hypothetical protein
VTDPPEIFVVSVFLVGFAFGVIIATLIHRIPPHE